MTVQTRRPRVTMNRSRSPSGSRFRCATLPDSATSRVNGSAHTNRSMASMLVEKPPASRFAPAALGDRDRRGRPEKRIRPGGRRCAGAARCRRRRRESRRASARIRSACGAAAAASADSRTATHRSRCARWQAPSTSSPHPITTSSATAPSDFHRHGPQRDDASGGQEQFGAERRPRGAFDRPRRNEPRVHRRR